MTKYYSVSNVNFSVKEHSLHKDVCLIVLLSHSGYKPYAVTHASDHFQLLYDLAVDLIRRWDYKSDASGLYAPGFALFFLDFLS